MRFNKLTLTNIGPYYGHYEFDFSITHSKRNVILFGGKNGAGKTTLLEAIRLVLFGPFTYGFKTESETYFKKIRSFFNKNALTNTEQFYQIMLSFSHVEKYQRNNYLFIRRWKVENDKIKETFLIQKNGNYLSELDAEILHTKIREETPPELFNLFLFDGEEISRIINDDRLSDYLKHSARVMFNLDLFESLEEDLNQYQKIYAHHHNKKEGEAKLEALKNELVKLQNQTDFLTRSREELSETLKIKQAEVDQLKKHFSLYGGLAHAERDRLISRMNELEHRRKSNLEELRMFITEILPIYLVRNELREVQAQMEKEQEYETYEYLSKRLSQEKLTDIVLSLEAKGLTTEGKENLLIKFLLDGFLNAIKPNILIPIHRASFAQRSEVQATLNKIDKIDIQEKLSLFTENQALLQEIQQIRKQIEGHDSTHDFKDLLEQIHTLNQEIEKLKARIEAIDPELVALYPKIEQKEKEIESATQKILYIQKHENSYVLAEKIIQISKRFRHLQLRKKLQRVEIEATQMLNQLFRKDEFVSKIRIDPETFDVRLFTPDNEELDKKSLSAGEKQILLLSIIWAMMKSSGRRLPFVFDTLLGRLDKSHKKSVLTKLIPKAGEQVIILSTDSEIDADHYPFIQPLLSRCYTIEFDKEKKKVKVESGQYFQFKEMELSV